MSLGLFENVIFKKCLEIIYQIYMYKKGSALSNLLLFIFYKTEQNQNKLYCIHFYYLNFFFKFHIFSTSALIYLSISLQQQYKVYCRLEKVTKRSLKQVNPLLRKVMIHSTCSMNG